LARRAAAGGLEDGGMAADGVLEPDAGDPLAAALDHVLGAVGDLHGAARIDPDHDAGAEPTGVKRGFGALVVVVRGGDPRAADLELADAPAVPRQRPAAVIDDADLDARQRHALTRAHRAPSLGAPVPHRAAGMRHGR